VESWFNFRHSTNSNTGPSNALIILTVPFIEGIESPFLALLETCDRAPPPLDRKYRPSSAMGTFISSISNAAWNKLEAEVDDDGDLEEDIRSFLR
jgi:hypothetical protein